MTVVADGEARPASTLAVAARVVASMRDGGRLVGTASKSRGAPAGQDCRRDPAPLQPVAELPAGAGQPAPERPLAPAQEPRRVMLGLALQIAKHDRRSERSGQASNLLVHHAAELGAEGQPVGGVDVGVAFGSGSRLLQGTSPDRVGPGTHRHAIGHAVQPRAEPVDVAERPRFADQDQERRLECVVDVMRIGEPATADPQDHRAVPLDEGLQGQFVAVGHEPIQELAFVQAGDAPALEEPVDLPESCPIGIACHTASRFDPR